MAEPVVVVELVPERRSPEDRFWSHQRFSDWCGRKLGTTSMDVVAGYFGIGRSSALALMRGTYSPTLELYMRMLSMADEPVGTWLDYLRPQRSTQRRTCPETCDRPPSAPTR